ncbi:unnamed protein product [Cuscuta campestris]|uniref:Xylanase inhibitor N-terminal domain-containing protein n=1 Tax=Cuscuta campestris TaxID=132261 RepID=A0A484KA51_9ASTE|nr:unnamed protein product [Cuscuta campestris]
MPLIIKSNTCHRILQPKGILVQDKMHLETSIGAPVVFGCREVETGYILCRGAINGLPIVFGCGEVETGHFLGRGAINGLLGLGNEKLDVTNLLSSKGFVRNSFSLCFTSKGSGRIAFGDKGDPDQMTTPLDTLHHESVLYSIRIEQISIGNVEFAALFDSAGSTVTRLNDEIYSLIAKHFDSLVKDRRRLDPLSPLEYCYETRDTSYWVPPSLNLKTKGGANFHVI